MVAYVAGTACGEIGVECWLLLNAKRRVVGWLV